ncbi:response regulator transcription factor [Peptococcaceae bacterium 1198_IL3148]
MVQKILVVDDDPKILKILKHTLAREGFEVICASGGIEAIEIIQGSCPNLVVLDIMMPGLDGFETLKEIKKISDVPIIILSARDDEIDKVVGFRMGVDDYQTKPFSPVELALRVKAVLKRSETFSSPNREIIKYNGLNINYERREVIKRGRETSLTPKEFELLWLLASNPNKVFTKAQLLNRVWGITYEGDDNTVNVHIRRLREKIEDNAAVPKYIKTVWGIGYKFDVNEENQF